MKMIQALGAPSAATSPSPRLFVALTALALSLLQPAPARADSGLWSETPLITPLAADAPIGIKTFATLARAATPGVVRVIAVRGGGGAGHVHDGPGQGTGFFIRTDGALLTNDHVVRDATELKVRLADDMDVPATVVGRDPASDVALLKAELPPGYVPVALPLGDSDLVEVGDWVVVIGAPFGLDNTVTAGIVSATGRRKVRPEGPKRFYADFIQTDASINRGSSGGPLLDTGARVVGIAAAINDKGQGIGFVIPVNMVKDLLPQLDAGKVERAWLGVRFARPAGAPGGAPPGGALVASVFPGGPADRAGLRKGDVILSFDGHTVVSHDELPWVVSMAGVGRTVRIDVARDGGDLELQVVLDRLPGDATPAASAPKVHKLRSAGVHVSDLDTDLAAQLGVAGVHGVVVTQVHAGGSGDRAGVREGDLVVGLQGGPVRDAAELSERWAALPEKGPIRLRLDRMGQLIETTVPRD